MYICLSCGESFETPNTETWTEKVGEAWGQRAYEKQSECQCPYCGSNELETLRYGVFYVDEEVAEFESINSAKSAIKTYEKQDREEGIFKENSYSIKNNCLEVVL